MKKATIVLFLISGMCASAALGDYLFRQQKSSEKPMTSEASVQNIGECDDCFDGLGPVADYPEYQYSESNVVDFCQLKADMNVDKYELCVRVQTEGYEKIERYSHLLYPEHWAYDAFPVMWNDATNRNGVTDYESISFKMKMEIDSMTEYEHACAHRNYDKARMAECFMEWISQSPQAVWSMTMWCYNKD